MHRMTYQELGELGPGDIIGHASGDGISYIVTANYGDRVTAVRTVDITNPGEWMIVRKAGTRAVLPDGTGTTTIHMIGPITGGAGHRS
jgi:hypothetical protein